MRGRNPVGLGMSVSGGAGGGVSTYTPVITQAGNTFSGITGRAVIVNGVGFVWVLFTAVSTVTAAVSISVPWGSGSIQGFAPLIDVSVAAGPTVTIMEAVPIGTASYILINLTNTPALTAGHQYMLNIVYPVG